MQVDAPAAPTPPSRLRPLARAPSDGLLLHEIFASIQGESSHAGRPCTFVRTTACNLRCRYCDTRHAFTQGRPYTSAAILAEVERLGLSTVEVTGGEPLLQRNVLPLLGALCDRGYRTLLETGGSLSVAEVDPRVIKVLDLKTPDSGEVARNDWSNLAWLGPDDEVKFVLGGREDYEWARACLREHRLASRCTVLMGAVFDRFPLADLAAWIVADRLPVRMQVQMHKVIWDPARRGV